MNKLEALQRLRKRWQLYAGEYRYVKEFNPIVELAMELAGVPAEIADWGQLDESMAAFILSLDEDLQEAYEALFHARNEFLVHKECFHPTYGQWCVCGYTTATEYVYLLDKMIEKEQSYAASHL